MESKTIKYTPIWFKDNELITPHEYLQMSEEERKQCHMSYIENDSVAIFAFCPLHNSWERYSYINPLLRFANNCKEYDALLTLYEYDHNYLMKILKERNIPEKKIIQHLKYKLKRLMDDIGNFSHDMFNKSIRDYVKVVQALTVLYPEYNMLKIYAENIEDKIKFKLITKNLKGDD
ncbi:MAG: hypothetical protein QXS74_06400 [Nitrososphaeria archaeon]